MSRREKMHTKLQKSLRHLTRCDVTCTGQFTHEVIFMVTPCISSNKYFIIQLMHSII